MTVRVFVDGRWLSQKKGKAWSHFYATCIVQPLNSKRAARSWIGERAILNSTNSYLVYVRKYHRMIAVVVLRMLLSQVFLARSSAHFITSVLGVDSNGYEKAGAYRRAALRLLFGGVH